MVELVERLIGKGYDLAIYDSNVRMAAIHGANREYILNHIPHISKLMVASIDEVLDHAGTIVIGNGSQEFRDVPRRLRDDQLIVDLVRIADTRSVEGVYDGICW
jgi:GDP-mannose 6-dehydrogenase